MSTTLPEEVERAIFELTARAHPKSQAGLFCLAKYVSPWIAAIMYETIIIGTYSSENTPQPPPTAIQQYGHHLRNLLLGGTCSLDHLHFYLYYCPNITNLAVWCCCSFNQDTITLLQRLPLTRLSVQIDSLCDQRCEDETPDMINQIGEAFKCLPTVTHLDLAGGIPLCLTPCIQYLPNLTYISLFNGQAGRSQFWAEDGLEPILKRSQKLKLIILLRDEEGLSKPWQLDHERRNLDMDDRVVSCVVDGLVKDWERGALGEPDLWQFGWENR